MTATLMHDPLTCSLASRIAAAEGDVPLEIADLNLKTKEFVDGGSLCDINPLRQVSTLRLDSGEIIIETSTVLASIQAQSQKADFRRDPKDPAYFQMLSWIAFCATELHKQIFRIVFYPEATDAVKDRIRDLAPQRFELLDVYLAGRPFLLGDSFSAADAYLTWFFVLAECAQVNPTGYDNLYGYRDHMLDRTLIRDLIESDREMDRVIKAA